MSLFVLLIALVKIRKMKFCHYSVSIQSCLNFLMCLDIVVCLRPDQYMI